MLHEARAQVALIGGDALRARAHLAQVKRWFLPTQNPVLIARCERLQREVGSGNLGKTLRESHVELRGAPVAAVDPTTSSRGALARKASG